MPSGKRKSFSIEEKSCIISKLMNGATNKDLAKEYGTPHSTISTIWKKKEKIKSLFERNFLKTKRARRSKHTEIDTALFKWYTYQRMNNVPINGPILQQKANDFARRLGEDFVCSSSWIHRFRVRHNIVCSRATDGGALDAEEWLTRNWPILSEGYGPDAIFNADETGLFYKMTPDKTLQFKGEQCFNGKMSEMRLTIMVAVNMTGTTKKNLLIVGQSKKPGCFKNTHSLPVTYENNAKAWMTLEIFEKWLRNWDAELKVNEKKILLLVDNCPAHRHVTNLHCIKLVFLPPTVSSVLQPMGQNVIRCLKTHYRMLQMLKIIQNLDHNKEYESFSVLDAILMISEAWEKVTQRAIANCFRRAGFIKIYLERSLSTFSDNSVPLSQLQVLPADHDADDDIMSLTQLARNLIPDISSTEVEDFINIDNSVTVCAPATDNDIVAEIQEQTKEQYNDEEQAEEQFRVPSLFEGLNAISVLRKIVLCNNQFEESNFEETLVKMERKLQNTYAHNMKCHKLKLENF
ncbi:tigger transposable element-derived protein 4-like [Maniola hyperantus]|uniref:tigger transposable element-derived protein 4-like n=1 Tax=Aphantopus hyperantus TaxID=2795564 RepID=UPI003748CFB8